MLETPILLRLVFPFPFDPSSPPTKGTNFLSNPVFLREMWRASSPEFPPICILFFFPPLPPRSFCFGPPSQRFEVFVGWFLVCPASTMSQFLVGDRHYLFLFIWTQTRLGVIQPPEPNLVLRELLPFQQLMLPSEIFLHLRMPTSTSCPLTFPDPLKLPDFLPVREWPTN